MYNKTSVKVLAQTPKMLFIYWEISEDDRNLFKKTYGDDFFSNTRPILVVYNDTMNYSFEVEIDDFANSWYLHINDANCEYHIELGRKPISHEVQHQNNFGIFNIKDLYKFLFPNESFEFENIVLGNTSSGALSSSGMFSSQFK